MSGTAKRYTLDNFMAIETDEPWELWDGELREVPGVEGAASELASHLLVLIWQFVKPRGLGMITMADGAYILGRDPLTVVVPDVGFIHWKHLPNRQRPDGYIPVRPDLVIEVRSPTDRPGQIAEKAHLYGAAGVPLAWWVDPRDKTVTVYRLGVRVAELAIGDVLDGEDVLPGFQLSVSTIFEVDGM